MGQRAERGFNGPKTLPEREPRSQDRRPEKWALGRQVAGRRDSNGWNSYTSIQMGGLGHIPGLPNTETRPARLGSPSVNHKQSNLQGKAYCHPSGVRKSVGCNGPFPTQTQYAKLDTEPIAEVDPQGLGQLCAQGFGRPETASVYFWLPMQLQDDSQPHGNTPHDMEQRSGVGLRGPRSF